MAIALTLAALILPPPPNVAVGVGHVRTDHRAEVVRPYKAKLIRMAWCESTGRWWLSTGNGFYGGLQFTLGTWHSVGGSGYPHWHSKLEQMYRAVRVYLRRGSWADWPVCGYR